MSISPQLITKLNVKLPYKIGGKVTVALNVTVPADQATNKADYRFDGSFTSPALELEGLTVKDFSAQISYQNGKLDLKELSAKIAQPAGSGGQPGLIKGSASAGIEPPGRVTADLVLERLPLGEIARAIPNMTMTILGQVDGKASFSAPYVKISDPASWTAATDLQASSLTVSGRTAKDVKLVVAVGQGVASLKDTVAVIEGIPLALGGTLGLTGKYAFDATLKTSPTQISDLRKLVPEANLPVPVDGLLVTDAHAKGTLTPFEVAANGTVHADKLAIGKTPANRLDLKWAFTPQSVSISDLKAELFQGTITGSAEVPLDAAKAGTFAVNFQNVDAGAATALIPSTPVKIAGKVSGKVTGGIPVAKAGEERKVTADVDLSAPRLVVQNIPADRLTGQFGVTATDFRYDLKGETLGGTFDVKGDYPFAKKKPAPRQPRLAADHEYRPLESGCDCVAVCCSAQGAG